MQTMLNVQDTRTELRTIIIAIILTYKFLKTIHLWGDNSVVECRIVSSIKPVRYHLHS
jgi:hypothetical protein